MKISLPLESVDKRTLDTQEAKYPLVVISDVHLGMKNRTDEKLNKFLKELNCETLVLNGDFVDGLRISARSKNKLSADDVQILDALNDLIARGTKVVYIPGNHDEALRKMDLYGKTIMGITFAEYYVHETPQGKKFFISHGDQFDGPLQHTTHVSPRLFKLGDFIYGGAARADALLNKITQSTLKKQFDLYGKVRKNVYNHVIQITGIFAAKSSGKRLTPMQVLRNLKRAGKTLKKPSTAEADFREAALARARKGGYDGVVCGHTHMPELSKAPDGMIYANSGDWIRHFSALAMNRAGEWELLCAKNAPSPKQKEDPPTTKTQDMVKEVYKIWPANKKSGGIYTGYKGA
jgi:UDP-2,3-diacylglucosamine pyrophosphatase LpxH